MGYAKLRAKTEYRNYLCLMKVAEVIGDCSCEQGDLLWVHYLNMDVILTLVYNGSSSKQLVLSGHLRLLIDPVQPMSEFCYPFSKAHWQPI